MPKKKFELRVGKKDVAYIYLPDHPRRAGSAIKQVRLRDVFSDYTGADIYLELDADKRLIGIEVLL